MASNLAQSIQIGSLQTPVFTDGEAEAQSMEVISLRTRSETGNWDQTSQCPGNITAQKNTGVAPGLL